MFGTVRKMKALIFKRYGGPGQVMLADIPRPVPKPDEILVQVHAAGLNPVDNKIREGKMKPLLRFQLPATLGSDFPFGQAKEALAYLEKGRAKGKVVVRVT